MHVCDVRISEIVISGRHRKDAGDLRELCRSIEEVGLLHPIVITPDKKLIAGSRRISAYLRLDRNTIPAVIADSLTDSLELLKAERDENSCRLDFSRSEAASMGMALEELERPKAKERQKQSEGRGQKRSENFTDLNVGTTRDKVGEAIGMSGPTYQRAKAVVVAADQDPDTFGPVKEEMDRTGSVIGAFKKVQEIKRGKRPVPPESSTETTNGEKKKNGRPPVGVIRANEAIDCLIRIPANDPHRKRGFQIVMDWIKANK